MLKRLLENIDTIGIFVIAALAASIMRTILISSKRRLRDYMVAFFFGVPVGVLCGGIMLENGFGDFTSMAVASMGALLGQDIILAILRHKRYLAKTLRKASDNLVEKYTK